MSGSSAGRSLHGRNSQADAWVDQSGLKHLSELAINTSLEAIDADLLRKWRSAWTNMQTLLFAEDATLPVSLGMLTTDLSELVETAVDEARRAMPIVLTGLDELKGNRVMVSAEATQRILTAILVAIGNLAGNCECECIASVDPRESTIILELRVTPRGSVPDEGRPELTGDTQSDIQGALAAFELVTRNYRVPPSTFVIEMEMLVAVDPVDLMPEDALVH
jgi:hypothetical protein